MRLCRRTDERSKSRGQTRLDYALQGGGNAKRNINVVKVFITKKVRSNGGSVLAPYQISRGTLPSIAYEKGAGDVLGMNLSLGSLVIDADTVVGELAEAIVANRRTKQEQRPNSFGLCLARRRKREA